MAADVPAGGSLVGRFLRRLQAAPRELELPVSTYGKLPIYKDFLRNRLTGRRAQELKQWLDRGISHHWASDPERRKLEVETHALLLSFPDTEAPILAYLWGSHDDGGLRRFPFTVFVAPPPLRSAFGSLTLVDALDQVSRGGASLRGTLAGLDSVDGFYRACRTAVLRLTFNPEQALEERLRHELAQITVGALAESLYGIDAETLWPALAAYLERTRLGRTAAPLAVRLPLSPLLEPPHQVALWLRMLGVAGGRGTSPPSILLPQEGRRGGVVVLGRPLRPDDVLLLDTTATDYEFVEDLRRTVPSPPDDAPHWAVSSSDAASTLLDRLTPEA